MQSTACNHALRNRKGVSPRVGIVILHKVLPLSVILLELHNVYERSKNKFIKFCIGFLACQTAKKKQLNYRKLFQYREEFDVGTEKAKLVK